MALIDLHIHSTQSDGTYSPEAIATYAKVKGLSAIALTDHDSIQGVLSCQKVGENLGLKVIPGIELSASYGQLEVHILGYNIDISNTLFLHSLEQLAQNRQSRNELILQKLNGLGLLLTMEDLNPDNTPYIVLTRAHFASTLLKKGYINHLQEAFDRYLGNGKPAYVPKNHLSSKDCINLIHDAGGVAILAHPTLYKLNKVNMYNLINILISEGLDGIECMYPSYTPAQTKDFIRLCKKYHLICTGGSDFHGENKPALDLGIGYGNLQIPESFLEGLSDSPKILINK
ncbi:MAG: PHP domain-containing protein [Cellulosilyticaceae bacterium]